MANYLLEIGTEEIPAKFMPGTLNQLRENAEKKLEECRLKYEKIRVMGTPRRLTLIIEGLAEKEEDLKEEVRGPAKKAAIDPEGKFTKAAEGFARSQGVPVESLIIKETGNGEYLFALREVKGKPTVQVLPEIVPQLITSLSFPKPMRWGDKEMRFARPIRWLVSLLDDQVVPFEIEGLQAGRVTKGHRFLGQPEFAVTNPNTYVEQLKENFVLVDQDVRRAECWRQIQELAQTVEGVVTEDEELLEEVTYLLEWPTALIGSFEESYLAIPEEVVITPMREHQRYFPVRDKEGKLLNRFITVRNGNAEYLDIVRAGNEKVLKARLADARFFWEEDQKIKLEEYLPRLEKIVFQESLGTVAQKITRIKKNVEKLAQVLQLGDNIQANALRAAELAKADLVTNMVYEFPELQGIMGRYYALLSGELPQVAQAILEHYQPRFAGDAIPASAEGALVSIADKMDTIAGCFAIGIEPTGSQDPYALRRQAMGICLILLGHKYEAALDQLIAAALANYKNVLPVEKLGEATQKKIKEFFQPRIKNILTDEGHRYDVIDAVLGIDYNYVTVTAARAQALTEMKGNAEFQALLTSFTRAYNLAKKVDRAEITPEYLTEDAEKALYGALKEGESKVKVLAEEKNYVEIIKELSRLAQPINRFFTELMVMAEDEKVRENRLGLLLRIVELTRTVGDLSKIVI
jgi:glycyl-tRNA synthetase beta chain